MNQETVLAALAKLGTTRRFFGPEHADLLRIARQAFYGVFGRVAPVRWFDLVAMQTPVDYMAYAECIMRKRPRVVVETGTATGSGALFYAETLRRVHGDDNFRVVTVEVNPSHISMDFKKSPQITSLIGSSSDPEIVERVKRLATEPGWPVMVTLDSDHGAEHVAKELGFYADIVSRDQYLVVQDTYLGLYWGGNLNGAQMKEIMEEPRSGLKFDYIGCPLGAVEAFLSCDDRFVVDTYPQRWLMTQCPFGFLLRER